MAERLRRNLDILRVVCKGSPALRRAIIKEADDDTIKCFCECGYNILNGNVPVNPKQKKELKKHKYQLRRLADINKPLVEKRKLLVQKGAGLPVALLLPIIAIASALLQ